MNNNNNNITNIRNAIKLITISNLESSIIYIVFKGCNGIQERRGLQAYPVRDVRGF